MDFALMSNPQLPSTETRTSAQAIVEANSLYQERRYAEAEPGTRTAPQIGAMCWGRSSRDIGVG